MAPTLQSVVACLAAGAALGMTSEELAARLAARGITAHRGTRRQLQGLVTGELCPPKLGTSGPLWFNASGLPEDNMYLAFLYISADALRGPAGATLWLDRTDQSNNVLLPGESSVANVGLEMYGSFLDVDTWLKEPSDVNATQMTVYVVNVALADQLKTYQPPSPTLGGPIPELISRNAVATGIATRKTAGRCNAAWQNDTLPSLSDVLSGIDPSLLPSNSPKPGSGVKASNDGSSATVHMGVLAAVAAAVACVMGALAVEQH